MSRCAGFFVLLFATAMAVAQSADTTGWQEIDACGVLTQGGGCVLFEGSGGKYVVAGDTGDFKFGDAVRVVGTLDPNCTTICSDADGCIRGATLYDPARLPCGTKLPNFPADILTNACTAASAALLIGTLTGLKLTSPRRRR